jgi:hypothetical protein
MSILEAFLAGKEARRHADAAEQVNAMQQFIGQNGQAIMGGDANALGQLAGFGQQGLQMAMGIQGDVQSRERQAQMDALAMEDRAYGRERDQIEDGRADQEWEMQLQEYKKGISAEEAAAEAAKIEEGVKMALAAPDAASFDAMMEANGMPEMVGQFASREMLAAKYMSAAEILKSQETPKPADEYGRYVAEETAKGNQPLDRIGFEKAKKGNGITTTTRNADGSETTVTIGGDGSGGREGKPTEGNLTSEGYLGRMKAAEEIFDSLAKAGTTSLDLTDTLAIGTRAEPYKLTVPEQKLMQAQRDWVRAKLRKESGAVIGDDEMLEEIRTYFPQPGEGAEVSEQKRKARKQAEEQLRITAGLPAGDPGLPPAEDQSEIDLLMQGP